MGYTQEQLDRQKTQDRDYLKRLKAIRKATGLNQEEFYFRYFKCLEGNINSRTAAQGKMKEIENGYEHASPAMLKIYAKLGNCTLDELVCGERKEKKKEAPKEISCADFIEIIDRLRRIGAIELELSHKDRPMRWGNINVQPKDSLPEQLPVESVSIWIENAPLSFELKEYLQVVSIENAATISRDVSDQLLMLWFENLKKRNNTITEGHSVTDARQDAYIMGHR